MAERGALRAPARFSHCLQLLDQLIVRGNHQRVVQRNCSVRCARRYVDRLARLEESLVHVHVQAVELRIVAPSLEGRRRLGEQSAAGLGHHACCSIDLFSYSLEIIPGHHAPLLAADAHGRREGRVPSIHMEVALETGLGHVQVVHRHICTFICILVVQMAPSPLVREYLAEMLRCAHLEQKAWAKAKHGEVKHKLLLGVCSHAPHIVHERDIVLTIFAVPEPCPSRLVCFPSDSAPMDDAAAHLVKLIKCVGSCWARTDTGKNNWYPCLSILSIKVLYAQLVDIEAGQWNRSHGTSIDQHKDNRHHGLTSSPCPRSHL
mmetsp:Transcript_62034/g.192260  ORF Transcript_62034/g.192260 Transcript_62034/m.192260 type:complete len:319 (+) Transcript_62034:891-1847(+)